MSTMKSLEEKGLLNDLKEEIFLENNSTDTNGKDN